MVIRMRLYPNNLEMLYPDFTFDAFSKVERPFCRTYSLAKAKIAIMRVKIGGV